MGFHRGLGNSWEGFPALPGAWARFMTIAQVDGADNMRVQSHYLVTTGGVADYISRNLDCGQRIVFDAVGKCWGWLWSGRLGSENAIGGAMLWSWGVEG